MTLAELLWLLPLMLTVATVLGVTDVRGTRAVVAAVRRRFLTLTLLVVAVGALIRALVITFA